MWNGFRTDAYRGIIAETIPLKGYNGDLINAFWARPLGPGPFPGLVMVHHMPGWDDFYHEAAIRFAMHGYNTAMPNLFFRFGHGEPADVSATQRAEGGPADDRVLGDLDAAKELLQELPTGNGKVGIIGGCSGGRNAFLAACRLRGFDAAVDLWGGGVIATPDQLSPRRPVAPIDYTKDLSCPLLGMFGNDDQSPSPEQVDQHEEELKKCGKEYEFYRYDGAGHGFFSYDRPAYRQQQAMDAWQKMFAFFARHLQPELVQVGAAG